MSRLVAFFHRFAGLFRRRRAEISMAEEMQAHLDGLAERNRAAGMSPEEARRAARRAFGGVEQIKERAREERTLAWVEHLVQDIRYGLRQLTKNPGFTAVAVISIAVAIGANTAIFSLIDGWMFKPLPVRHPEQLVMFSWVPGAQGGWMRINAGDMGQNDTDEATGRQTSRLFSSPTFDGLRQAPPLFAEVFATAALLGPAVMVGDTTERVGLGQLVSGETFRVLGVEAMLGRVLTPADDTPGASPVMVISYRYWHSRFAADPEIIGKVVTVNGTQVAIVGVTPPGYLGTMVGDGGGADLTVPLVQAASLHHDTATKESRYAWLRIMGRLKPGATPKQVRDNLEGIFLATTKDGLPHPDDPSHLRVTASGDGRTEAQRRLMLPYAAIMLGMVGLLLFATCANVGNLLLARGTARRREIAVRMAVGASRTRIVRQLLTESLLLSALAGALGLLLSRWGLELLGQLLVPEDRSAIAMASLDWRVLNFTATVVLTTNMLLGLVPALRATQVDLVAEFQGGRTAGNGPRSRLNKILLIVQVAMAFILLTAAGLFVRTVQNLRAEDIGFERSHLLLFAVDFSPGGYKPGQIAAVHRQFAEQLKTLPGVESVTSSLWPLLSGYGGYESTFSIPGRASPTGKPETITYNQVGPTFFATFGIPFVLGHDFGATETTTQARTAVVNRAFARKYFGDASPIGKFITLNGDREIVGIVGDIRQTDLRAAIKPTVFIPEAQVFGNPREAQGEAHFAMRVAGDPLVMAAAVRKALSDFDRRLPLRSMRTQEAEVDRRITSERVFSGIAGAVGILSLTLASIGLYGLMSFLVLRRTGEIGLRLALGALPGRVLRELLRESLGWVAGGVVLGAAVAAALMRLVRSFLFGVSPVDPLVFVGVSLLLVGIGAFACWLPARRAARVDPAVALRCE